LGFFDLKINYLATLGLGRGAKDEINGQPVF
jgi:hypothetical protein